MEVIMFVCAKSGIIGDNAYCEFQNKLKVRGSGQIHIPVVRKG